MHRLILIWSKIRKYRNTIIIVAVVAVFAVLMAIVLTEINRLNDDIKAYESEVAYLNEKRAEYEVALKQQDELMGEIAQLENRVTALREDKDRQTSKNLELAEQNNELERLNGELLKKYNGLSKPR